MTTEAHKHSSDPSYRTKVVDYFKAKADDYDLVDHQVYWRLSDTLLWETLDSEVLKRLPPDFTFLDAGGGTGRWSDHMLCVYPQARGHLYDLSPDMVRQATIKAERKGYSDRLAVKIGLLENVEQHYASSGFDLVFNAHNVLGFVDDPGEVIKQLANLLKPGGMLVSFLPNKYHLTFFNIFVGNLDEAEMPGRTGRGRFTAQMPYIHLFTPHGVVEQYDAAGLSVTKLTGFPNAIYPGMQETAIRGSTASLENMLGDPERFDRVLAIERALLREPDIAARGNNIFVVGTKNR